MLRCLFYIGIHHHTVDIIKYEKKYMSVFVVLLFSYYVDWNNLIYNHKNHIKIEENVFHLTHIFIPVYFQS